MHKAVIREIKEEVGVVCEFVALVSIMHLKPRGKPTQLCVQKDIKKRHWSSNAGGNVSRGGASDLFCTCLLRTHEPHPKLTLQVVI